MSFKLFYRPTEPEVEIDVLVEKTLLFQERSDVFLRSIDALLHFLKSFAIDDKEIHADRFKSSIDDLNTHFNADERPKRIELKFEQEKAKILSFIEHQHAYIADREKELRDIIELLTKAMASLDVENREFYDRVHDQSEKMEKITRLDDIKKIKSALAHEISQMREIVDIKKDQDRRKVRLLAGQVDTLRRELEKTRAKSMTDGLTGIYNREALDEALMDLIERSRVMNTSFSLLLLDLDDFKKINDTHGHLIGDRVLMAFSQKCRDVIRGDDVLARYGGEEFIILLPGASFSNALKKGRQICDAVASARYATSAEQDEDYLSVTVSIGVTAFNQKDTTESIIGRADKALYKAKRGGKNRVVGRKP
ncbi:MAG: GGDEF domain-containing protein [Desulfobacteraceae bacterium]|jgi:diguanylate cyclase